MITSYGNEKNTHRSCTDNIVQRIIFCAYDGAGSSNVWQGDQQVVQGKELDEWFDAGAT